MDIKFLKTSYLKVERYVEPGLIISIAFIFIMRFIVGLFTFDYFITEDVYANLVFSDTINTSGSIFNIYSELEPRIQDLPPLFSVLSVLLNSIADTGNESIFILLPYIFQIIMLAMVYRIAREIFAQKFLAVVISMIFVLGSYNLLWISSFSPVDSLLILLTVAAAYCFLNFYKTQNKYFLVLTFMVCGTLSATHNFGNVFVAILLMSFTLVYLIDRGTIRAFTSKDYWFTGISMLFIWLIFGGIITAVKALEIYLPGVIENFVGVPVALGPNFLGIVQEFFPPLILALSVIGAILTVIYWKPRPEMQIFLVWLIINVFILMIIPSSFSHRSRYPLQFLPAIVFLAGFFLYVLFRCMDRKLSRKYLNLKYLVSIIVVAIMITSVIGYSSNFDDWKRWVADSYGVRGEFGEYVRAEAGDSEIMYIYWPSFLHSYSMVPSPNLHDYSIMIQNSKNLVREANEIGIEYFVYDRLSGYYYPYPNKGLESIETPFTELTEVGSLSSEAKLYGLTFNDKIQWSEYPISSNIISASGFFQIANYHVYSDAHGLINPATYQYIEPVTSNPFIEMDLSNSQFVSIFLALKLSADTKVNISVEDEDHNVIGELNIDADYINGWEWWFEYYRIDLLGNYTGDLKISFNIIQGSFWVHEIEAVSIGVD